MRINCPHCGDRDSREFEYLGSAKLLDRPENRGAAAFHEYVYTRKNPTGENAELWQHVLGCRAWLHVIRNVTSHEILVVKLAQNGKGMER